MPHLTDAVVKRLLPPKKGNKITYDDVVPGFGVRVTAGGARSFVLNYLTQAGRERRITIGSTENWQTTAARERARQLKRDIDAGGDPLADIETKREAPTVTQLIERFEAEHLPRKRAGTAADYRSIIITHIAPHFGKHAKVAGVSRDDVQKLHDKITRAGHLHRANRVIAVLGKMFSLSVRWNMRADNPARGIERHYEAKRKRYVNGEELQRLTEALNKHSNQTIANVFRLLLLTGARRGEVLAMRFADVDLSAGKWIKPSSMTKQKMDHEVPLSAPVRQLLSQIAGAYTAKHPKQPLPEFVFPGNGETKHVVEVKKAWRAITKAAGISGLRIHDLRHSFASQLASGGASLPLIGALLGHSNPTTTHRYAHLFSDPLKEAVERVGAIIGAAGRPPEQLPVQLPRRGR